MTELMGVFLRVCDAVTGTHQVELTGPDGLLGGERITVLKLALEEPCHGLETKVGVRSDIGTCAGRRASGPR